jgi:two-component system sensor histidine kinase SaeS
LDPARTHLDQVIAQALESQRLQLGAKGIRVSVSMPNEIPPVCVSAEKSHRVLSNHLQNAVSTTPQGSRIQLSVNWVQPSVLEVRIEDEGPGVNDEAKERIFERYRTDQSRTRDAGGAGLGLAISKRLVALHGGDIGVQDREDHRSGAVFWIKLPLTQETPSGPLPERLIPS